MYMYKRGKARQLHVHVHVQLKTAILLTRKIELPQAGYEPTTNHLPCRCSTNRATEAGMWYVAGLSPA